MLYISEGVIREKMPNVEGKDIEAALEMLDYAGFTDIDYTTYVDSDEPENEVVTQSVNANEEIPINTKIVLTLSKGPTEPPAPPEVEKSISFALLPDGMVENYQVTITRTDTGEVVFDDPVSPETESLELLLTGSGTVMFEIKIADAEPEQVEVVFSE